MQQQYFRHMTDEEMEYHWLEWVDIAAVYTEHSFTQGVEHFLALAYGVPTVGVASLVYGNRKTTDTEPLPDNWQLL